MPADQDPSRGSELASFILYEKKKRKRNGRHNHGHEARGPVSVIPLTYEDLCSSKYNYQRISFKQHGKSSYPWVRRFPGRAIQRLVSQPTQLSGSPTTRRGAASIEDLQGRESDNGFGDLVTNRRGGLRSLGGE